jgi:F0F1-type ATP synthase membrane subunit c/vacuolar-type H+-ATPase subunit K
MNTKRILEIGGLVAGVILVAFGIGALAMSFSARNTVSTELKGEYIVGSADMNPTDIAAAGEEAGLPESTSYPTCDVADEKITTGAEARCFAQYMRIHALESSGGLTYAQMGRFVSAADPSNPAGTNDVAAAQKDENGAPVSNSARNTWVTETALSTALNVSYMAEQIALFGLVVGFALLLSGIGFIILAVTVLGAGAREEAREKGKVQTTSPATS